MPLGRVIDVDPAKMLVYGCGDVDSGFRLAQTLTPMARAEEGNWNCFQKIIMPAMRGFAEVVEVNGISVDTNQLAELQAAIDIRHREEFRSLIRRVPRKVKQKHLNDGKALAFSRPDFVRDILFSKDGFKFKPRVFTKSTSGKHVPDNERVASTSAKDHLPYFQHNPFVADLIDFQRLTKMQGTYVGHPAQHIVKKVRGQDVEVFEEATGFWQYIENGYIHPSFSLHRTVTGRSSSDNPNAQNFPKRGKGRMKDVVKAFRRVFAAKPGFVLLEADLSQIELRIAAWMANERNMIELYRSGADIHAATAAASNGMTMTAFNNLPKDQRDMLLFQAKAIYFTRIELSI